MNKIIFFTTRMH